MHRQGRFSPMRRLYSRRLSFPSEGQSWTLVITKRYTRILSVNLVWTWNEFIFEFGTFFVQRAHEDTRAGDGVEIPERISDTAAQRRYREDGQTGNQMINKWIY
jgi:hypothetical protein